MVERTMVDRKASHVGDRTSVHAIVEAAGYRHLKQFLAENTTLTEQIADLTRWIHGKALAA